MLRPLRSDSSGRLPLTRLLLSHTLLVLLLATTQFSLSYQSDSRDVRIFTPRDCQNFTETSNCVCSLVVSQFQIQCPRNSASDLNFIMHLSPGEHIQIDCDRADASEYSLLPPMSIGKCNIVQIKRCPLPGHFPISRMIFNHLGISQVKYLMFESSDLGANLTRVHLSGLQNLDHLRFSSNGLTHLPADLFADLSNLKWLDLRSNNVELPVDVFAPLQNLTFLELGHNKLKYLPPGIFRNQQRLTHLNLWGNELRNLSKEVFEGAESITDLDISSNGIETFQPEVFALLTNLTTLSISGNELRTLPAQLFEHNKNLTDIWLINNRAALKTLPPMLFANLPRLREVRLICDLETVPEDLFANSGSITNLTMKNNKLRTLPAKLLADQYQLYNLDLSNNRLESLPDDLFANTRNLVELILSNNQLTSISSDIFAQLRNLEKLVLNNNRLVSVDLFAFRGMTELRELHLENNHINLSETDIAVLSEPFGDDESNSHFQYLLKLRVLNLRNNSVMYIFNDWRRTLGHLELLDLSYNNISRLTTQDLEFLNRNELTVNLTHNQIREINLFNMHTLDLQEKQKLLLLDLNSNPIYCNCLLLSFVQVVRGQFDQQLKNKITLDTSDLTCVGPPPLVGRDVHTLEYEQLLCPLDDEQSTERKCPPGCECWVRTYDYRMLVNCSNGNLTRLPTLPHEESLRGIELTVENNRLAQLPLGTTLGYADVKRLNVAGNQLHNIAAEQLPSELQHLDLRRNHIQRLNVTLLEHFNRSNSMHGLYLSHNPWTCDCETKPLLEFTQSVATLRKFTERDFQNMVCVQAKDSLKARKFVDLSVADICQTKIGLIIAGLVTLSLVGTLIGALFALYYKYQREVKVWLYAHNLCLWFVTEEELDKDKQFDAFVSYSNKDRAFITDYLVPQLEHGPIPFKLCLHERDWKIGEAIPDQIVNSVDNSRRTVVILSQNFIESVWARMEFRAAHQAALTERRTRVIVIIYGDIGNINNLDIELQAYLKTNTYLQWGDPWFWDKLRYALPHRAHATGALIKSPMTSSVDDKLELIKPSPVTPSPTTPPAVAAGKNPLIAHLNGGTPQMIIPNGKTAMGNGTAPSYPHVNGKLQNGHVNGAFIINTNAKQSDV